MTLRVETYIMATGTIATQALIDAETQIKSFPLQADQGSGVPPWAAPMATEDMFPTQGVRTALDGSGSGTGWYRFNWHFDRWTTDMMDYWLDTFMTTSGNRVKKKLASVRAYDLADAAIYLNCMANWPKFKPVAGGYEDIVVPFDYGTLVTA
jgi:hypothetical protein